MRFLLHPTTRTATAKAAGRKLQKPQQQQGVRNRNGRNLPKKSSVGAAVVGAAASQTNTLYLNSVSSSTSLQTPQTPQKNPRMTKQWGQQCGPCACVLRFEAEVDEDTQRVQSVSYTAKEVMTTVDEESGRLQPVYTARTNRPMFLQECQCQSLHALAQTVTSYLPSKKIQNVRPDFSSNRSSSAFRHAVLSSHDLPTTDTHCFDVVEDAFTAMIDGVVPSKSPINVNYTKLLKAEMTQRPLVSMIRWSAPSTSRSSSASGTAKKSAPPASFTSGRRKQQSSTTPLFPQYQKGKVIRGTRSAANRSSSSSSGLGSDRNNISMSSPRSVSSTLNMFDLNNNGGDHDHHYWDEEDYYYSSSSSEPSSSSSSSSSYPGRRETWSQMDWLSFVDEQYYENDTDNAETATSDQRSA